jgi:IS30 family transposase
MAGAGMAIGPRRHVVQQLSAQGTSTRAIAAVAGVDHATVIRDLQVVRDAPVAAAPMSTTITGVNGKTYQRPDTSRTAVQGRTQQIRELADTGASTLTIAEFAAQWQVTPRTVRNWRARGDVQTITIGRSVRVVRPSQEGG